MKKGPSQLHVSKLEQKKRHVPNNVDATEIEYSIFVWMNLPIWKYRYWVFFSLLLVWMTFFDRNSFLYRFELASEISDLEESIKEHEKKIVALRQQRKDLFGNVKNLEKFARETYLMKKDDEEIFIIVDPE